MIYTKLTKTAIKLAYDKHMNQTDKSGIPYILHPVHVAEQMDDEYSTTVALLHDVIEDTNTTFKDLEKMGFPFEVIEALKCLTHKKEQDYFDYIKNISKNEIATKVKIADLIHNSDLSRLDNITTEDLIRVKKYEECLKYLQNIYNIDNTNVVHKL